VIKRGQHKRIALVFSGQPRFTSIGAAEQLKLLPEADVFFHTWELNSQDDIAPWIDRTKILFEDIETITRNPQTKKYEISRNQRRSQKEWTHKDSLYSMYHSIYRADKLRQEYESINNFEYDVVIKTRFDYLQWGKMLVDVKPNIVLTPKLRHYPHRDCDYFFIADSPTMSKITNLFKHFDELYKFKNFEAGEELLALYALKQSVNLCEFETSGILIRDASLNEKSFGFLRFNDAPKLFLRIKIQEFPIRLEGAQKELTKNMLEFLRRIKMSFKYRLRLIIQFLKSDKNS
jgi:hypothetical protein